MSDKKTILVVDDDKEISDILKIQLEANGFQVFTAGDGEEGLSRALEKHPDLVLLDVSMPKMNGIQMLEKLREDAWGAKARVIFLTVVDQSETLSRAIQLGGFEYFVKTEWKIKDIVERIRLTLH